MKIFHGPHEYPNHEKFLLGRLETLRLALVGLDDSTVFVDGFFSQEKRLEGLRQAAMIEGLVEQEQNKLEHEIHLKMGNEQLPDIPKGKGKYFTKNYGFSKLFSTEINSKK